MPWYSSKYSCEYFLFCWGELRAYRLSIENFKIRKGDVTVRHLSVLVAYEHCTDWQYAITGDHELSEVCHVDLSNREATIGVHLETFSARKGH